MQRNKSRPTFFPFNNLLKVGDVFFQNHFRKLSRAEYQNKLVANQQ